MTMNVCRRWSTSGWLWVVALLALPNCALPVSGIGEPPDPDFPKTSAVFCDIEVKRECVINESDANVLNAIRLNAAAVALTTGDSRTFVLDESETARGLCDGKPQLVTMLNPFPKGEMVCLKCGLIGAPPAKYADVNAVCKARCLFNVGDFVPLPPDPPKYCTEHARASTNTLLNTCFSPACTVGGSPILDGPLAFVDPRLTPVPVKWRDGFNAAAIGAGNDLTRTLPSPPGPPGTGPFDAGAVSEQWITKGDAYVEFSANENTSSHILGLTVVPDGCAFPCTDTDPDYPGIAFALSLNFDKRLYIIESGDVLPGPGPNGSARMDEYAAGERFRISLRDNSNGTAEVKYSKVAPGCLPGNVCAEEEIFSHTASIPTYRFRVDTAFRESPATLTDVRVVFIKPQQ
jgi:hypothetical protein